MRLYLPVCLVLGSLPIAQLAASASKANVGSSPGGPQLSDLAHPSLFDGDKVRTDGASKAPKKAKTFGSVTSGGGDLIIRRGDKALPYSIPVRETLNFDVRLDVALIGKTKVGDFKMSAGVDPYVSALPLPGQSADDVRRVGWIRTHAWGDHLSYKLDHHIEMRVLPMEWPQVIYKDTQRGSENRRRELRYGRQDDKWMVSYRRDHHCGGCKQRQHYVEGTWPFSSDHHCKKCKRWEHRVWKETEVHEVPEGAVDMLGAIFLARAMVSGGKDHLEFPLIDKLKVWQLSLDTGRQRNIDTPAGLYACRKVTMKSKPGEADEEAEFKGLFGIQGDINIWLHIGTGVPVLIEGDVPLGPFTLDVELILVSHEDAPEAFLPVEK